MSKKLEKIASEFSNEVIDKFGGELIDRKTMDQVKKLSRKFYGEESYFYYKTDKKKSMLEMKISNPLKFLNTTIIKIQTTKNPNGKF